MPATDSQTESDLRFVPIIATRFTNSVDNVPQLSIPKSNVTRLHCGVLPINLHPHLLFSNPGALVTETQTILCPFPVVLPACHQITIPPGLLPLDPCDDEHVISATMHPLDTVAPTTLSSLIVNPGGERLVGPSLFSTTLNPECLFLIFDLLGFQTFRTFSASNVCPYHVSAYDP